MNFRYKFKKGTLKAGAAFVCAAILLSVSIPAFADIYTQEIPPLTDVECAQCHVPVYADLKERGGAHQMGCRECHATFHNFRRSLTWEERVPGCQECHGTPHGEQDPMGTCLVCHTNSHAPATSLSSAELEPYCSQCHQSQTAQLNNPSAHTDMGCVGCHAGAHGYVPDCTECHVEPHNPFKSNAACTSCHPVHDVSGLNYGTHIENEGCSYCHSTQAQDLGAGHLAHSMLNCTFCHAGTHGKVPTCQECHNTPHTSEMLEEFSGCADCHGNAHNLLPGY